MTSDLKNNQHNLNTDVLEPLTIKGRPITRVVSKWRNVMTGEDETDVLLTLIVRVDDGVELPQDAVVSRINSQGKRQWIAWDKWDLNKLEKI